MILLMQFLHFYTSSPWYDPDYNLIEKKKTEKYFDKLNWIFLFLYIFFFSTNATLIQRINVWHLLLLFDVGKM